MSDTHFVESQSTDPVERAIARKVLRILNDGTLDRQQRESLVRAAQKDLLRHRRQLQQKALLQKQVAQARLPQGYRVQAIQVDEGQMHLGAVSKANGYVWLDAGAVPEGAGANHGAFVLKAQRGKGKRSAKAVDPIAERRREMSRGNQSSGT